MTAITYACPNCQWHGGHQENCPSWYEPDHTEPERGRWWGPDFCPHIGDPVIDGCYFCGRAIPNPASGEHGHTMYEKKGFRGATEDRYSCVCPNC